MELDRDLASVQEARNLLKAARVAQQALKEYSREQVDAIVKAMKEAGEAESCRLAALAVEETGMGRYEDKCFKNYFASHHVYEYIKDMKTVGIVRKDEAAKLWEIAEPAGVIAGIVPTTNPTSTTIFKALCALKAITARRWPFRLTLRHVTLRQIRLKAASRLLPNAGATSPRPAPNRSPPRTT